MGLAFCGVTFVPRAIADVRRDTLWRDTVHIDTVKLTPITRYAPDDVVLLSFTEKRNSRMLLKTQRDVPEWFRVYFTAPSADVPVVKGLNFDEKDAFLEQRNATGDTLTNWLRPARLLEQDTNTTIADIATQCGFGTIRNYQTLFKEKYGLSPSQYRNSLG